MNVVLKRSSPNKYQNNINNNNNFNFVCNELFLIVLIQFSAHNIPLRESHWSGTRRFDYINLLRLGTLNNKHFLKLTYDTVVDENGKFGKICYLNKKFSEVTAA